MGQNHFSRDPHLREQMLLISAGPVLLVQGGRHLMVE